MHSRATKARYLNRLKGMVIESVAWSPAQPTTSTREILLGTQDGTVYECYIEASEEFMRRDERYMKQVLKVQDGQPIMGVYVDALPGQMDLRRVIVTTATKIMHFVGKISRHGHDIAPIFTRFFESEVASTHFERLSRKKTLMCSQVFRNSKSLRQSLIVCFQYLQNRRMTMVGKDIMPGFLLLECTTAACIQHLQHQILGQECLQVPDY